MKILFNVMTLSKGGAERVVNILANEFVNNNDVLIVANKKSDISYHFDSKVSINYLPESIISKKKLKKLGRFSIKKLLYLKKYIVDFKPDIIISFLPEPSLRLMIIKKIFDKKINCPIIISERNDPNVEYNNKLFNNVMKKVFPLADGFVFQTDDAQKYFKDIINCKQKIILNPIDDSFVNYERNNSFRKKEIVTVGRLEKQKNQILLIDSFKMVTEKSDNYILKIFGEGSEKENLLNYIKREHLEEKVFLMGNVSNIKDNIKDSTLFVLSSNYEGLPNALIEAMALGVPCISTDCPCGGPRMLIKNNYNGILVPTNDRDILAKTIINTIQNTKLLNKISNNSRLISKKLRKEVIVQEWLDFICEVKKG